jgi:hypothetical protein
LRNLQKKHGSLTSPLLQPLQNEVPPGDGVLYMYYEFETTQNKQNMNSDKATVYVPDVVCSGRVFRIVRDRMTSCKTARDVARGSTRSGTIR